MIPVIAGVGFVGLVFICLLVLCIKRNRRKNNCPSNSLPNTTGSQPLGKTQHIYYVPGNNYYKFVCLFDGFLRHLQQYFSYIVAVSFIGGVNRRNRRKPPTCRKENEREKK